MTNLPDPLEIRVREHGIHEIFLKRWSPRALSGESVSEQELLTLFEAARWAPSTYNEQEWRFLWARRGTPHWDTFFSLLLEANQVWCERGSYLIAVIARQTFARNNKENPVAVLDTGAAMENFLLQAAALGLVAHPMAGFDWGRAANELKVPKGFLLTAMIVVGRPGKIEDLPSELGSREVPTTRKPLSAIAREGFFTFEE